MDAGSACRELGAGSACRAQPEASDLRENVKSRLARGSFANWVQAQPAANWGRAQPAVNWMRAQPARRPARGAFRSNFFALFQLCQLCLNPLQHAIVAIRQHGCGPRALPRPELPAPHSCGRQLSASEYRCGCPQRSPASSACSSRFKESAACPLPARSDPISTNHRSGL